MDATSALPTRRILVIGSGGAGKSTLATQLGASLNLEVVHLDAVFLKPGWAMKPHEEQERILAELVSRPHWVMDGNWAGTLPIRLKAADTVVFLDFPTALCLGRIVKRWWQYRGRTRPDVPPGCPERLNWDFVKWVANYRRETRPRILQLIAAHADGKRVVTLRGPREAAAWRAGLAVR